MKNFIWYEKYRERKLSKLILPKEHKIFFRKCIKQKQIPHLLLVGPYGSGKTTLAHILINKCASAKLILNASSYDRGINIIKTKVKAFSSSSTFTKGKTNIVFFDEADGMTPEAQGALKNTIEAYQANCRFIFTANRPERVHGAIKSRCQTWDFQSLDFPKVLELGCRVLETEGVEYRKSDLKKIAKDYYPDIRMILNILQQNSPSGKLVASSKTTDKEMLQQYIKKGLINAARNIWKDSTDFLWLYQWLFEEFAYGIEEKRRAKTMITIAEYLYRDRFVADKEINAVACLLEIMTITKTEIDFEVPF